MFNKLKVLIPFFIIVCLSGCNSALANFGTVEPKIGIWEGEKINFIITEDGFVQEFSLVGEPAFNSNCQFILQEEIPIVDDGFQITADEMFTITVAFESSTMANAEYEYSVCPNPASFVIPDRSGTRVANWQDPAP